MDIRIAAPGDGAGALAVYAQYIGTPVTFECGLPSEEEFARRIRTTLERYPYLVCTDEAGRVRGYAYAHQMRERRAYQWGAELSVYLDAGVTARGLGRRLYAVLTGLLRLQGVRTVYGCVTTPNPRSERLHERMGFRRIGVFRNAGFKGGAWHDVTWFEKEIAPCDAPPGEFAAFPHLAPERVAEAVAAYRGGPDA
ncbi:MAG: N-acetyltransferase [Lentisphaeria bacterium]|nr:N-acetyltransferase [Lentisphaeria bacterium]